MQFCEATTIEIKTVIVVTVDETFQRKALCSTWKLMSLAKSCCVTLTSMFLECFLKAAYTKRLELGEKVGSDWCSRQVPLRVPPATL